MKTTVGALCLCLLLQAALAAVACAQDAASNLTFTGGRDSFTVPFELVDNRIFVEVWLEGQVPFKFILDTGGDGILSNEAAARIGAKRGAETEGRGAGESIVRAWQTSVREMRLGGLALTNQPFTVFDFSDLRHVFGAQTFDGVIGLSVFSQSVVRVDYGRRRLTFTRPSKFSYGGAGVRVPFERERLIPVISGEWHFDTAKNEIRSIVGRTHDVELVDEGYWNHFHAKRKS